MKAIGGIKEPFKTIEVCSIQSPAKTFGAVRDLWSFAKTFTEPYTGFPFVAGNLHYPEVPRARAIVGTHRICWKLQLKALRVYCYSFVGSLHVFIGIRERPVAIHILSTTLKIQAFGSEEIMRSLMDSYMLCCKNQRIAS